MIPTDEKHDYIEQAIEIAKLKGFKDFRAKLEDFETPKSFTNVSSEKEVLPDFTARRGGKKHYFDIALKTDNIQPLITKWKLLSQLAELKNSHLILFAPRGHKAFAERLTKLYKVRAQVEAL
ncbi:MAG TPA: hypothetical protein VKZ54_12485 [Membranihabitans sp.]|nr:hypothetical protein [Membranihabitans sp.]